MHDSWPKIPWEQQRLRRLRQAVPVSVSDLAAAAKCSRGHLRRIETTSHRPSPELATRLARELSRLLDRDVAVAEFYRPDRPDRPRRAA